MAVVVVASHVGGPCRVMGALAAWVGEWPLAQFPWPFKGRWGLFTGGVRFVQGGRRCVVVAGHAVSRPP